MDLGTPRISGDPGGMAVGGRTGGLWGAGARGCQVTHSPQKWGTERCWCNRVPLSAPPDELDPPNVGRGAVWGGQQGHGDPNAGQIKGGPQ